MVHQSQRRWSCDRCHALKERCRWAPGSFHCERCARLGQLCQSVRPQRKPGRPPRDSVRHAGTVSVAKKKSTQALSSSSTSSPSASSTLPRTATGSPKDRLRTIADARALLVRSVGVNDDLSGTELRLLDSILFRDDFLEQFVVGPSFCEAHRKFLVTHLLSCKPSLQDSYLAFAMSWGHQPGDLPDGRQLNLSLKRASLALSTLRSFQVRDIHDVSVCLVLGVTMLSFALKLGAAEARTICDQTLSLIKPVYESVPSPEPTDYGFIYCIVLTDIAECLLLTKRPTLRINLPPGSAYIDRHIGLLATILPHLHDIAELSSAMLHGTLPPHAVAEALEALELAVHSWRPPMPDELAARYSATEVTHMFCQAQTTRLAAMLILHRLRHPFGSQPESAQALASTILVQLDLTLQTTGKIPRCIDLPLIVACLEIENEAERVRWLRTMSPIAAYSSPFHERIKRMIAATWTARRRFSDMYWYHLGSFTSLAHDVP